MRNVVQRCWRRVLYRSVGEEKGNVVRRSDGEERCREVLQKILEKSVAEKCCTGVLEESVVERCWGRVQSRCWRKVFRRSVGEECNRELLYKRVVVLQKNVGEEWLQRSDGKECCREVQIGCREVMGQSLVEKRFGEVICHPRSKAAGQDL